METLLYRRSKPLAGRILLHSVLTQTQMQPDPLFGPVFLQVWFCRSPTHLAAAWSLHNSATAVPGNPRPLRALLVFDLPSEPPCSAQMGGGKKYRKVLQKSDGRVRLNLAKVATTVIVAQSSRGKNPNRHSDTSSTR